MRDIPPTITTARLNGKWHPRWPGAAALIAATLLAGCATGVKDTSRTFGTVVIDAGHGGIDSGARSRWGGQEKHAALDVARRLEPKLRAAGFQTKMTRANDVFIPLDKRVQVSNSTSNSVFVSIHFNHAPSRSIRGAETYYKSPPSRELAGRLLDKVVALPGTSRRGVKTANFRVLRLNRYPAVLVECGFLSNPSEGARCATAAYRERLADAIADGLVEQRFGAAGLAQRRPRPSTTISPPTATPPASRRAASKPLPPSGRRAP